MDPPKMKRNRTNSNNRKLYTLAELLAQCDPKAPICKEDREWLDDKPVGRELI